MKLVCGKCGVNLKAKNELAGKTARCPKCGTAIDVPPLGPRKKSSYLPPATERQKEYAVELGISFSPDIDRREISKLIDEAVQRRDDDRYQKLSELSERESEAWQEMCESVLEEIDQDDCRLSTAQPSQMLEELSNRGRCAILISYAFDDVEDFRKLTGVDFNISFSDDIEEQEMQAVLMCVGFEMYKKIPK